MAEVLGQIAGWGVVLLIFWIAAHTVIARPIIRLTERAIGREWFPFIDRIFPR
jgi:hypothetical protein